MPGRKGHTDRIVYLNVYMTDKEPTYQLHTGSFSKHRASELLPSTGLTKLINDVTTMSVMFGQCMGDGEQAPNEGCAHFEIRVALSKVPNVLATISRQLLSNSLVTIPVALWWSVTIHLIFIYYLTSSFTGH
jgi:hypothetical protein